MIDVLTVELVFTVLSKISAEQNRLPCSDSCDATVSKVFTQPSLSKCEANKVWEINKKRFLEN